MSAPLRKVTFVGSKPPAAPGGPGRPRGPRLPRGTSRAAATSARSCQVLTQKLAHLDVSGLDPTQMGGKRGLMHLRRCDLGVVSLLAEDNCRRRTSPCQRDEQSDERDHHRWRQLASQPISPCHRTPSQCQFSFKALAAGSSSGLGLGDLALPGVDPKPTCRALQRPDRKQTLRRAPGSAASLRR